MGTDGKRPHSSHLNVELISLKNDLGFKTR